MLKLDKIDLAYGSSQILYGVEFEAKAGEVACIMGPNGVGKTSMLKAMVGLHPVTGGTISLNGKDITRQTSYETARQGMGYVPQGRMIFPRLTVEENLKAGFACLPKDQRHIPDEVFELFPILKDFMRRFGGDLSGGQQQQLAIARALITQPKVLILDEPTEGIQPNIISMIGDVIDMLIERGDMAIVLVEQYFDFAARMADTFTIMRRGEIIASGRKDELGIEKVRELVSI